MVSLNKLENFKKPSGPIVLCIMDGIALGPDYSGNAVNKAYTPFLDWLKDNCLGTELKAHGTAVGMPSDGDMGNSEVGHNAIGNGRVVSQGATLVKNAIATEQVFDGEGTWSELVANTIKFDSTLHFIGLLSDGNVHSHIDHLKAMIVRACKEGVRKIRIHTLLDGRDVGETSALEYIDPFEEFLDEFRADGADYRIASGGGRMKITMDRYGADWSMVKDGWDVHVRGIGRQFTSAHDAITCLRQETEAIDQDLPSFVIANDGKPVGEIKDNDSVVLFNFRGDRAMELCNAFELDEFDKFERPGRPNVLFAGMMAYDAELGIPANFLVSPPELSNTMGEYLARTGLRQLAISETQKFGHVTYFFNGNRSGKFDENLEEYVEIPSDNIPFEQRPWMKAAEITDRVIEAIQFGDVDFIRLNYPNGDMVGHTGNLQAAIIAVETVDLSVGRLISAVKKFGGILVVTADHGNADEMYEFDSEGNTKMENGRPKSKTNHTLNPVPCYIFDPKSKCEYSMTEEKNLGISCLAATCINLLGYVPPDDYDRSLIEFRG